MSTKQQILAQPETEKRERANTNKKPRPENYGYEDNGPFEPGGWVVEGGEQAYYEAVGRWYEVDDASPELSELKTEFIRFLDTVRSMRAHQKAFYNAQVGSLIRRDALIESKKYEKMTDQFLKEQSKPTETKPTAPTLF